MCERSSVEVRSLTEADDPWRAEVLRDVWGSTRVARLGQVVDAGDLDGVVAEADGDRVGLLTWALRSDEIEVVTLQVDRPGIGAGRALLDAARLRAEALGARRLWLTTTNDNTRALRFYQRWGFDLVALHRDDVARARELKPGIPRHGADGIPMRHELELELRLR